MPALVIIALLGSVSAHAQSAILQRGYDAGVTGATLVETTLNTTNVTPSTFGLVFKLPVDAAIFAQPLYVPNVVVNQVSHNVLYVATMNDTIYAFDADVGGAPLWSLNLATFVGATPVPIGNFVFSGNRNIVGNDGILSTPLIDLPTNTMYAVACTLEGGTMVYRLHALDIRTGVPRSGSGVKISGSYGGSTFDGRYVTQRVSLALTGSQVVFGFAALELEYAGGYTGWVMAYDKGTLAQTGIFATVTSGNRGGGVWQSGRPPVIDSAGFVYVFTGNAYGNGYDGVQNFSESVLKLDPTKGLALADSFTPGNWLSLEIGDLDLTSSGPMLIPGTNEIAGGGKTGDLYVLNTSNLGKLTANDSQIPQKLHISTSEIRGGPVYWQRSAANGGPLMYNWGISDSLKAWAFNGTTFATSPTAQGSVTNQIFPGGILTLSANGEASGSGVVWATTAGTGDAENNPPVPGVLYAFDAGNVAHELWNSTMNASRDGFGNFAKFVPPLVANGRVYVATWSSQVAVYGLLSGGTPDFQISVSPTSLTLAPGSSTSYTVNVSPVNGFASAVTLSVAGAPSGVTTSFTPGSITGSGSATLHVTASASAPTGNYPLTVTGMSGATSHAAIASLMLVSSPFVDSHAAGDNSTPSMTVSAPGASTTSSNELLLAFIAADYLGGANTTVTGVSGGGLTWSLVQRTNAQSGTAEIWRAFAPTPLSNVTITAALSQAVCSSIYVASFANADSAIGATASASGAKGAPTGSLVSTRANSLLFGVGNDFDNAIGRTPGSGQSLLHQYFPPTGDTYWVQQLNAPSAAAGVTLTLNDTAPTTDRYNLALVEVRPPAAGGTFSISGALGALGASSTVALSGGATATVTADSSGNFTFNNVANGSYTVTPSKAGVSFTPTSLPVTVNGGPVTNVNFTATSNTYSISGALGVLGASSTVALSGGATATVTADSSGNFTYNNVANGSYTVTPSKAGVSFTPTSLPVTVNGGPVTNVNFTATSNTYSISGALGVLGASSTVALSGGATATVTADSSGNYTFSNVSNGSYTVTPSKAGVSFTPTSLPVTVNGGPVTNVNFTATAVTTSVAEDAAVFKDNGTASKTLVSPALSTTAVNELLLAFIATDYLGGANTTVSGVAGGGLTWTLVARANTQSGTAEIWKAFAASTLSGQAITATLSQSVVASLTVLSFSGVDATGNAVGNTAIASSPSGAPSASLTTTRNGSLVVGVGNDYDNAIPRTLGSGQSLVHQYFAPTGDTYWVQMRSALTPTAGTSVTLNDTAPTTDQYNLAIAEVRGP